MQSILRGAEVRMDMVNLYFCLKDSLRIVSYQAAIIRPSDPLVNAF